MNNQTLIDNLRCVPDFPRKGINFRDVTTLFKSADRALYDVKEHGKDGWAFFGDRQKDTL